MKDCIFCKLISREVPPKFIYESDLVVAFYDTHPKADIHILVVSKKHITNFMEIKNEDQKIVMEMIKAAQVLEKDHKFGIIGYKVVFNGGRYSEVPHLHWHILGDVK